MRQAGLLGRQSDRTGSVPDDVSGAFGTLEGKHRIGKVAFRLDQHQRALVDDDDRNALARDMDRGGFRGDGRLGLGEQVAEAGAATTEASESPP